MLNSFRNIRFGLMVGIGGGAPNQKHDIRLGDIVVSAPRNGKGGVYQYDFGKTIQDQKFRTTGFLNQPPRLLRAAVTNLAAQYEEEGHQLEDDINTILESKPRLRKNYKRPDQNSDRLYQSKTTHPLDDESACTVVCGNEPSNLISRPERSEDEDNPAIHYGLIASANQLMKDASIRDRLAEEEEILCFEMEAAGLMNQFPCLVIRGICDYSDTHKNKQWQGYAAMAAAAYAKALLCRIPPNEVQNEKKIVDILSNVQDRITHMSAGVDNLLRGRHIQEHETILEWLTPVDYTLQHSDYISRREPETGQWFLDSTEFQTWLSTGKKPLFCPGIPGAGKTIITAIVVDHLLTLFKDDANIGIAYIYCNFRRKDEQRDEDLLASLLKQLSYGISSLPSDMQALYDRHKERRTRPSFDELSSTLQAVVTLYSRVFIVIDALDECQVYEGYWTKFLSEISSIQVKTEANYFATSRIIPEIIKKFEGSMILEIRARDDDMRKYLDSRLSDIQGVIKNEPDLQEEVKTGIIQAVPGMFLLAQLHLDSLAGMGSPKDVRKKLGQLPKGSDAYDKAYTEAMERIQGQVSGARKLARGVLSWIICASRSLTTLELQHALAVEVGEPELDKGNLPEIQFMVSVCAGLVTVDDKSHIIRLVHYTTQEYFERMQNHWFPNAQANITTICVTYLSFGAFENGTCSTTYEFEERLRSNKLYNYAARNWGSHACKVSRQSQEVMKFLKSDVKVAASAQVLLAHEWRGSLVFHDNQQMKGLHLAAYFGIQKAVEDLLEEGAEIDVKDINDLTPLSWAVLKGHEDVVKLLLEKGAEIEPKVTTKQIVHRGYRQKLLTYAVENKHKTVVRLLKK
ncbi:hypothetical protein F5884DRAFT_841856 [Xylogone sp. PMI_703]|nr:hypothetical protein F5884DRAFT_841856 [Xylogone sp. PMI_703]